MNRKQRRAAARAKRVSSNQSQKESAARTIPAGIADFLATARKLHEAGRLADAEVWYRRALAADHNNAEVLNLLGIVAHQIASSNLVAAREQPGKLDEAIASYRGAIRIKPGYAEALANLGVALEEQGKLDDARKAFEKAIEIAPARAATYRLISATKRFSATDPHLATMEKLARDMASLSAEEQIDLHFALGKAYADFGDHSGSFRHLLEGNALKRQRIVYDEQTMLGMFSRIRSVFTVDLMRDKQSCGYRSSIPVFIVGMPRSGTTLIEQILASHAKVFGAGELNEFLNAVDRLNSSNEVADHFPEVVSSMGDDQLRQVGASYVSAISALAPKADRVIDKMPMNFLFAGLIHLALPHARIIHARRDPLDTCLSCFSKLFTDRHLYSYDLGELGRYYRAYELLMEHWRRVLPPGVMLEVEYERLTADLEGEARRIIIHCGLQWDPACLSFHETERLVRTASAVQVRQPIYRSSIGRWRAYEHLLGPLIDALGIDVAGNSGPTRLSTVEDGYAKPTGKNLTGTHPGRAADLMAAGRRLHQAGQLTEAETLYRRVLAVDPGHADALNLLGLVAYQTGRQELAVKLLREAILKNGRDPSSYSNLGNALYGQGNLAEAVAAYRQAIRIKPHYPEAHSNLGAALEQQGKLDEAVAEYHQAIRINPDYADAHLNLGVALEEQGKLDQALNAFERAIELAPQRALTYRLLSDVKRFSTTDPHLAAMERLARDLESLSVEDQIELHFALGKAYADVGDHEQSFQNFLRGNTLKRQRVSYDEAETHSLFSRIRNVFTLDLMRSKRGLGELSRKPVFIIGMPRSGTTLVEQILASHPSVFGAGELEYISKAVEKISGPDTAWMRFDAQFRQLGASYVNFINTLAPNAERVVDKMPMNFLFAGLIHLALPNARFIHTRRDPIDTCVSCFTKLFSRSHPYSYDLAELGGYYRAYEALMEHWRKALPPGVMLEVQYEDLVADLDSEARRIIAHCGLPWDDACLSFHKTDRPVRTTFQVRQPIYHGSIGRWRLYKRQLGPLITALGRDSECSPSRFMHGRQGTTGGPLNSSLADRSAVTAEGMFKEGSSSPGASVTETFRLAEQGGSANRALIEAIKAITVQNELLRIDCLAAGPNNQDRPSVTLLIPANQAGSILWSLTNAVRKLEKKLREQLQQAAASMPTK
jgi:tetratricopeptide (TPR) repeat protein